MRSRIISSGSHFQAPSPILVITEEPSINVVFSGVAGMKRVSEAMEKGENARSIARVATCFIRVVVWIMSLADYSVIHFFVKVIE